MRKTPKTICSIEDMGEGAQREQRQRWRKNSLNYLKKIEKILVENMPPISDKVKEVSNNVQNTLDPYPLAVENGQRITQKHVWSNEC